LPNGALVNRGIKHLTLPPNLLPLPQKLF